MWGFGSRCVDAYLYSRCHFACPHSWGINKCCILAKCIKSIIRRVHQTLLHWQTPTLRQWYTQAASSFWTSLLCLYQFQHAHIPVGSNPVNPVEKGYSTLRVFLFCFRNSKSPQWCCGGVFNWSLPVQLELFSSSALTAHFPLFSPSLSPFRAVGHTKVCKACFDGGCYRHWLVVL